jgi:membrane dipeptidase
MKPRIVVFSALFVTTMLIVFACSKREFTEEQRMELALEICQDNLILDSHIDWPESVLLNPRNISEKNNTGEFDIERARMGGLNAVLSVLYINYEYDLEKGRETFDSLYAIVNSYSVNYPKEFAPAVTPKEVKRNFKKGFLSIPLCLENGSIIGSDLDYISKLKDLGITYITLSHNRSNQICDANADLYRPWKGLSPFGEKVVDEMNRQGIMIDISHSSDKAVKQVLERSKSPIIATHSSCRHFTPGYERNLSDELIIDIAEKEGVIMVAFGSMFLDSICSRNINYLIHYYDSTGISYQSEEGMLFLQDFWKDNRILAEAEQIVDHIDHIAKIAGIDHVGLGSDFDGVGPTMPEKVPDVSSYPIIVNELLRRGYSKKDIDKILAKNYLRVWRDVLDVANSLN